MQPRPAAMSVRQSAAPSTRDKSPPPSASSSVPSLTPKASAVTSSSEPTPSAASAKPKRRKKKKANQPTAASASSDRRLKSKARDGDATASEPAAPAPVAMVTDAGAVAPRPYRGKCLYQSRKCENERALKRNGLPHNLCEEHRSKQNQHQRKFDAKKFSRKRRSDTDGELEGDDSEPTPHDKKRPRIPTSQPLRQHQQQPVPAANPPPTSVEMPPRVASFAPTSIGMAPPLVSLAASPAHALYAGSATPMAPMNFRVGTSPSLGHSIASQIATPGVSHLDYQRFHTQDGRQSSPTQRHLPPQHHDAYAGRPTTGYSLSELEAARILVPTSMATSSGAPAAYTDSRSAYQQPHPYQQHQEYYQQQQQQPVIRRTASMPDRPQSATMLRPQVDARPADPSPRVLPPLLRPPPMPMFAHVDAQRPQGFAPGISTSAAPPLTLRSPLLSTTSAPLPTVPRLSSLGSAPMTSTASELLPSLAPIRVRRSSLPPATSQ